MRRLRCVYDALRQLDRKSTRLNSSHMSNSYAVFCLKKMHPDYDTDGMEFVLAKPDPYPLKTYIDYGLHELATEEEQKTDPITSIIELLGSISPDEQLWLQILIRATKKDGWQKE